MQKIMHFLVKMIILKYVRKMKGYWIIIILLDSKAIALYLTAYFNFIKLQYNRQGIFQCVHRSIVPNFLVVLLQHWLHHSTRSTSINLFTSPNIFNFLFAVNNRKNTKMNFEETCKWKFVSVGFYDSLGNI